MLARYYRELLNYCMRRVRDRDVAADLAQESYVRVLTMERSGQLIREPIALLKQVALHAKIDMDRRAAIRQHDDLDGLLEAEQPAGPACFQPEEAYASAQRVQAYMDVIDSLPPRCREAFILYLFEDLPYKQIAKRMGVSVGLVTRYIKRGKLACIAYRQSLNDDKS